MMRPQRARIILATARLATRKAPVRLASRTEVKSSSLMRSTSLSRVMPALDTSTSTGPSASSTAREGGVDLGGVGDVARHGEQARRSGGELR